MRLFVILLIIAFSVFQNLKASDSKIIIDTQKESPCLCGEVQLYGVEKGVEGFLVEELTPDFDKVVRSTYSDKQGYFEFPNVSTEKIHYICVSDPLYQTVCYKVKISKKAKQGLKVIMHFK